VQVHPQEPLLQRARALQASPAFAPYRALRQVAEHRLARLVQLGIRQARYRGRSKTLFQAYMAATVANLTLLAAHFGPAFACVLTRARLAAVLGPHAADWRSYFRALRRGLRDSLGAHTAPRISAGPSNWPVFGLSF
jgi:hypothetical protein